MASSADNYSCADSDQSEDDQGPGDPYYAAEGCKALGLLLDDVASLGGLPVVHQTTLCADKNGPDQICRVRSETSWLGRKELWCCRSFCQRRAVKSKIWTWSPHC